MMFLWCNFWRVVRSGFGLYLVCVAWQAQALTLELTQAQVTATLQGKNTQSMVRLPYHWDRHHQGQAGEAVFTVPFDLPAVPDEPYGLYIPRLGNAYEIWLNGTLLQRNGDLQEFNGADFAKAPRHIEISSGLLRVHNQFQILIRADIGRRGGLAPLVLGPQDEVYPLYLKDYRGRSTGSFVVVILSLLMGVVALALWATQVDVSVPGRARRDPLYLIAAVAELCWSVSVCDAIIERPPLDWPWWGVLTAFSSSMWIFSMMLFCVEVAGWSRLPAATWLRRWLGFEMVAALSAAVAALVYGHAFALTLAYGLSGLTSVVFVSVFIWKAYGSVQLPHKIVAGAVFFNALVGLRDLYVFRLSQSYGGNTMLRYSSLLFGLTLVYIVIQRFRSASAQARDLMETLAARVAQKEHELEVSYQRVEQLARVQERTSERARILRDMHDGVGAHISTAIRQLESGRATQGDVLHTLRDSLDQLKLSIDAMNLPAGDITALLANLRYRLEPRLTASDIELQWDVDQVPVLDRLDDKAMRHLQFMVFEALSNVLQHAHASVVRIELHATPEGGGQLLVIDNGHGFDPESVKRRGLSSLRERAAAITADLHIASAPGKTVVRITLA